MTERRPWGLVSEDGSAWRPGPNGDLPLPQLLALDLAVAALKEDARPDEELLFLGDDVFASAVHTRWNGPIVRLADLTSFGEAPQTLTDEPAASPQGPFANRALWVAPARATWRPLTARLDSHLAGRARLVVVGSGPLGALLSRVRPQVSSIPADSVGPRRVVRALGYEVTASWGLYGLRSVTWAALRLAADHVRRWDLADRFEAAHREALVDQGRPDAWSIAVCVGRKAATQ